MKLDTFKPEETLFSDIVHSSLPEHVKRQTRVIDWEQLKQLILGVLLPGKDTAIKSGAIYDRIKHDIEWKNKSETYQPIRKACTILLEEEDVPVGSCWKGYYLIETKEEAIENMKTVSKTMLGLERRQTAYAKLLNGMV